MLWMNLNRKERQKEQPIYHLNHFPYLWVSWFGIEKWLWLSYVSGTYRRGSPLGSGDHRAVWLAGFASGFVLRVWWHARRWASQVRRFSSWLARGALVFSHQIRSVASFPSLQCQPVLQDDGISPRLVSHKHCIPHIPKWRSIKLEGIIASNM